MITSITIQNFRVFRDFTLGPLDRINLIAGKNNVGKTALLEALFLYANPAFQEWPPRLNFLRGFDRLDIDGIAKWGWLFRERDTQKTISITSGDSRVEVAIIDSNAVQFSHGNAQTMLGPVQRINTYNGDRKHSNLAHAIPCGVFLGSTAFLPQQVAEIYSTLQLQGKQDAVVEALKTIDPRIQSLTVLYLGGVPMVYADVGLPPLIPIHQMGDGIVRLISIVLEIARAAGGIMLIDEVENGIHYSAMPKVWSVIAEAARAANVQVFATTHSWEAIVAAHEAFGNDANYDFRLHRLQRQADDIQAISFDKEALDTAITMGLEVR
ncbi:MAG: ATPase [Chlorobi bacterium CHB2]|nr:ATPase [Chlorobi bacterium CHB2]